MFGTSDVLQIVALLLLAFFGLLVGYYVIVRLRRRRQALSLELESSRELVEDRAFNQVQLAKAAADQLQARGVDTSKIRSLVLDAEAARSRGDHDSALAFARSAQESLARLQKSGTGLPPAAPRPSAPVGAPGLATLIAIPPSGGGAPAPGADTAPSPTVRLPRNKAEARFQITLLSEEIQRAATASGPGAAVDEATALRDQAQAASDRSDYTQALGLALKGRRRIGGRVESLPATPATAAVSHAQEAEAVLVCAGCGEKLRPSDRFCRYCGTLRGPARCPSCGAAADDDGAFCAKCGAKLGG